MITEERAEAAVEYLRDTADLYGQTCGRLALAEKNLNRIKALQTIEAPGKSVAERETLAYASEAYAKALEELRDATTERETMRARRDAAELTIEVWRSQYSGRKAGVM
jgi:hypothetical protein